MISTMADRVIAWGLALFRKNHNGRFGKPPTFQFYASDWLSDGEVRAMTLAERGLYAELLALAWREHGLPDNPAEVRRWVPCQADDYLSADKAWSVAWARVGRRFEAGLECGCGCARGGRLRNTRQEKERAFQRERSREKSEAATVRERKKRELKLLRGTTAVPQNEHRTSTKKHSASASSSASALGEGGGVGLLPEIGVDLTKPAAPANFEPVKNWPVAMTVGDAKRMVKLQKAGTSIIARIRELEFGHPDAFNPGAWWGHERKAPIEAKVETLLLLGKRLEVGQRPAQPWAYCQRTLQEKIANYHGRKAEEESDARLKAAGRLRAPLDAGRGYR